MFAAPGVKLRFALMRALHVSIFSMWILSPSAYHEFCLLGRRVQDKLPWLLTGLCLLCDERKYYAGNKLIAKPTENPVESTESLCEQVTNCSVLLNCCAGIKLLNGM